MLNVLIGVFASVSCVTFKQAALKIFYSEKDIMASQRLTKKRMIGFKNAKLLIIKIDHNFKDKLIFLIKSSVVCHDAFSLATSIYHLVQRIEVQKKRCKDKHVELEFPFKETKHFRPFWYFFWGAKEKLATTLQFFLHEMLLNYCLFVGIFKGSLVKCFAEKVARGNSVQIGPDFPAKSLNNLPN